jgi:ABC-type transport system involved in multi-copper enzyme maturation permease subunit
VLKILIQKELKAILLSPKFFATFGICSLLLLISVFIGIKEYQAQIKQYDTGVNLANQEISEETRWRGLEYKAFRRPDPMQIFVAGLGNDIGRWSKISQEEAIKLKHSIYSDDPIFAVFRFLDFTFIVQIVLTLFAILFTYDAVCGEREQGMLRMLFANSINRAHYITAKIIGSWLGLVIPILIPTFLCILLVIIFGVPLTSEHWIQLITFLGISGLFFTFFIVFGVFISSMTRRSSVSFLISLMLWVLFVLIIPRVGVMAAGQIVPIPRLAEIEGQRDAFAQDKWNEFYKGMEQRLRKYYENSEENDEMAQWYRMEEEDSLRKEVQKDIENQYIRLMDEFNRRQVTREKLAFNLSRLSPASAYQLAVSELAGTDIGIKNRYIESMSRYRKSLNEYIENKREENGGGMTGIQITMSSEIGLKFTTPQAGDIIDISDMPKYIPDELTSHGGMENVVINAGIIGLFTILAFAGAFIRMLKYDVR